jgi:hypothetical protein
VDELRAPCKRARVRAFRESVYGGTLYRGDGSLKSPREEKEGGERLVGGRERKGWGNKGKGRSMARHGQRSARSGCDRTRGHSVRAGVQTFVSLLLPSHPAVVLHY